MSSIRNHADPLIQQEQEKFLKVLSHQRHDWLNHFQVLLGYLKLQKYDFCEEYIKKVTDQTNNDSRIAQLGYQPLVAYLLTFNALHKELSIEIELPIAISLKHYEEVDQQRVYELITGMVEIYRRHASSDGGSPNSLVIMLQWLDNKLFISMEFEGMLDEIPCLRDLHLLVDKFGNEEGFFVEGLHNNEESIMEFYVPLSEKAEVEE